MTSFSKRKKEKEQQPQRRVADLDEFLLDQDDGKKPEVPEHHVLIVRPPSHFYVDEQVRKIFDPQEIEELAASMKANGQILPIRVYPPDEKGKYKIDKGERRWQAAQLIDGFELEAFIDPEAPVRNKRKRIVGQIIENDQRSDLRPLELAHALEELVNEGLTMEEVAVELGWITKSKKPNINKVSRILSVLKLPEEGRKLISDHVITDLITLEFLRKIFEINPSKFSVLCDLAREDEGLSRKRAEQEYKQCKSNENSDQGGTSKTPSSSSSEDEEPSSSGSEEGTPGASGTSGEKPLGSQPSSQTGEGEGSEPVSEAGKKTVEPSAQKEKGEGGTAGNEKGSAVGEKEKTSSNIGDKTTTKQPTIHVEWRGLKSGVLVFDEEPKEKGFIWMKLENGDLISAELEELKIKAVSFG
ncbi:MAG: ParB/RepB/Spo0J family partition protein [gamma proteobacterium symbiont of Clathrolucina costata]